MKHLKVQIGKFRVRQLKGRAQRLIFSAKLAAFTDNEISAHIRTAGDGFLVTPQWKAMRERVLDTYGWQCMRCKITPKRRRSVNVDHVKPRKSHPELALDFDNLQVLCGRCNKRKGNTTADYRPPLG